MSDAAGIVVMAVIFAFGVVAAGLMLISVVPATMLIESRVSELRRKRREADAAPPAEDGTAPG